MDIVLCLVIVVRPSREVRGKVSIEDMERSPLVIESKRAISNQNRQNIEKCLP